MENITDKLTSTLNNSFLKNSGTPNVDTTERVISIAAGAFIFYKGLKNIWHHPIIALQEAAVGGVLLYRGATGVCPVYTRLGKDTSDPEAINITERFIVNVPRETLYRFWSDVSNLPKFMKHLKSVEQTGDNVSHWVANTPGNIVGLSWNAEVTRQEENAYIGWRSIEGSMIDNAGKVEFSDALNGTGTELLVEISYFPPAGSVGRGITSLFNGVFEDIIREDINNFKHYVEAEEFKTFAGLQG